MACRTPWAKRLRKPLIGATMAALALVALSLAACSGGGETKDLEPPRPTAMQPSPSGGPSPTATITQSSPGAPSPTSTVGQPTPSAEPSPAATVTQPSSGEPSPTPATTQPSPDQPSPTPTATQPSSGQPSPTPAATQPPSGEPPPTLTATFPAVEDTYVRNTKPDQVYGARSTLEADNSPSVKRILIRFQVTGIPAGAPVTSATLRMFVVDASPHAGEVHTVDGIWSEGTTTWSNAPAIGQKVADLSAPAVAGTWREADVSAAVTGNGDIDFYVVTPSEDGVDYSSRETGANAPTLVVSWSGSASPPPPPTPTPAPLPTLAPTPTPTLTPSPPPSGSLRFAVKGDWGAGSSAQAAVTAQMCEWRQAMGFVYVLTTGDNFYDPDGTATQDNYYTPEECLYSSPGHQWRAAWGNHDYSGTSTQDVLGSPSQPKYYSWTAGDVAFFVYDGTDVNQAQRDWLRDTVCSSTAGVKIIYGHQPPYSTSRHGSNSKVREMVHPVARDCGVSLVLSGHDHLYERSVPMEGVTYIVTGGGGSSAYSCGDLEPWVAACYSRHHFLYVVVDGETIQVQAVDADGQVFDAVAIQH